MSHEPNPVILVPLAHIAAAPRLALAAATLASRIGGDLHLLHVVDVPMSAPLADADARRREAEPLFAAARAHLPPHVKVRTEVRVSHLVGAEIRAAAIASGAKLLVVGWRADFSLKSLVVGTLQPVLARPPCDVLLVDLDRADALEGLADLRTGLGATIAAGADVGVRIVGAVAASRAANVLVHAPPARAPAQTERRDARIATVMHALAPYAPPASVRVALEPLARPLHRLVGRAVDVVLILVTPFTPHRPAYVRPPPGARFEQALTLVVANP